MAGDRLFSIKSGADRVWVRNMKLDDDLLDAIVPGAARTIVMGEWVTDDAGADLTVTRGGDGDALTPDEQTVVYHPVWTDHARTDVQTARKLPVVRAHFIFEALTYIVNTDGLAVHSKLSVQDITIDGVVRRGLALATETPGTWFQGWVTAIQDDGGVRFINCPQWIPSGPQ